MTPRRWFVGSLVATIAAAAWSYVYWLTPLGRSAFAPALDDPSVALRLVLRLALSCLLIATLLRAAVRALPWYSQRVGFVLLAGVTATFWARTGPLAALLYDLGTWLVAGLVLARFITERTR